MPFHHPKREGCKEWKMSKYKHTTHRYDRQDGIENNVNAVFCLFDLKFISYVNLWKKENLYLHF